MVLSVKNLGQCFIEECQMNKYFLVFLACILSLLVGCANVVSTNDTARVPVPSIASSDSLADIEIKEMVRGQGCATKTLGFISSGDKSFLDTTGKPSFGVLERAKAAATYNALSKDGLTTDILVNPVWEIHTNDSFFVNDVCARVVGYRGVIKGFKPMQTVTRAPEYKTSMDAPIEKRATNSHFANLIDESEHEVIIHEEAHPAHIGKHGEGKKEESSKEEAKEELSKEKSSEAKTAHKEKSEHKESHSKKE
jgi:hypothetical protein